jgi:hypothetical protein
LMTRTRRLAPGRRCAAEAAAGHGGFLPFVVSEHVQSGYELFLFTTPVIAETQCSTKKA